MTRPTAKEVEALVAALRSHVWDTDPDLLPERTPDLCVIVSQGMNDAITAYFAPRAVPGAQRYMMGFPLFVDYDAGAPAWRLTPEEAALPISTAVGERE